MMRNAMELILVEHSHQQLPTMISLLEDTILDSNRLLGESNILGMV
jgi:hypothetical protein